MLNFEFININIYGNIYSILIVLLILSYILEEKNLNFFKNTNTGGSSSSGGGNKKPSGDNEPDPKNNDETILAGLLSFVDENKKLIMGLVIGALVLAGGYFILNHYEIVPDISSIFSNTVKEELSVPEPELVPSSQIIENISSTTGIEIIPTISVPEPELVPSENILPTTGIEIIPTVTEQVITVATNSILTEALSIERFQSETIPSYFNNLSITEESFTAGLFGFNTYQEYKEAVLTNFLNLYENLDRNIIDIHQLTPTDFIKNKVLNLYVEFLKQFPKDIIQEIVSVQKEIVRHTFREEEFLVDKPELIPIFRLLMVLIQARLTGVPANI